MDHLIDSNVNAYVPDEWRPAAKRWALQTFRWADWACGAQSPTSLITNHYAIAVVTIIFAALAILPICHAYIRHRGRYAYLLFSIYAFAVYWEVMRIKIPDTAYQFHAQSLLTWFGRRVPSYVLVGMHAVQMYPACVIASTLGLDSLSTSLLSGMLTTLIALPFDMMGTRLLFWTWHAGDPRTMDRFFDVPYFHLFYRTLSVAVFLYAIAAFRRFANVVEYEWRRFPTEMFIHAMAIVTAPNGALLAGQLVVDYAFHQYGMPYGTSIKYAFGAMLVLVASAVWQREQWTSTKGKTRPVLELTMAVMCQAQMVIMLALFMDPGDVTATSIFQPIGSCHAREKLNLFPYMQPVDNFDRPEFVCLATLDEPYFDFSCVKDVDRPKQPVGDRTIDWYAVCGKALPASLPSAILGVLAVTLVVVALILRVGNGLRLDAHTVDRGSSSEDDTSTMRQTRYHLVERLPKKKTERARKIVDDGDEEE